VQNIRKITRTMQLIATARFQRSFSRATRFRPYSEQIARMVANVSAYAQVDHPLLRKVEQPQRIALLIISANRGLCGGYNSQVINTSLGFYHERRHLGLDVDLSVVGKKGNAYMRYTGVQVVHRHLLGDNPTYAQVEQIADGYRRDFVSGKVDAVYVGYMRFHSASRQNPEVIQLLPATPAAPAANQTSQVVWQHEYEFTPPAEQLLAELLPEAVSVRLYQCFMDAVVSEHVARMISMKAATDNATEMIKSLTRDANRARQSQITGELTELMGGAEAM